MNTTLESAVSAVEENGWIMNIGIQAVAYLSAILGYPYLSRRASIEITTRKVDAGAAHACGLASHACGLVSHAIFCSICRFAAVEPVEEGELFLVEGQLGFGGAGRS